jgi:CubicO group peptidase (beta-lactamase class C family)
MKNNRFFALFRITIFTSIAVLVPLHAQDRFKDRLTPALEQIVRDQQITGLAAGVVEDGRLVYARGFGVMTLSGPDKPVTPETLFHMASITKLFVATSVMQLWEQGKVDLDSPVAQYVSYFQLKDARYKSITVRHMLTHTSGMPDVEDYLWNKPEYDDGALERYVRSLKDQKLRWDPGTKFAYSNMAYEVLGDLVAKVSGMSFEDYVDAHILKPLGMSSSTLLIKKADPAKLAAGHAKGKTGPAHVVKFYPYNRAHTPSSDLHSNVTEMARWAMANLNRGELDGQRILKSSTYDVMWKPAAELKPASSVGISWFLTEVNGERAVLHNGGDDGFRTRLVLFPPRKAAVIFMTNCDFGNLGTIDTALTKIALE